MSIPKLCSRNSRPTQNQHRTGMPLRAFCFILYFDFFFCLIALLSVCFDFHFCCLIILFGWFLFFFSFFPFKLRKQKNTELVVRENDWSGQLASPDWEKPWKSVVRRPRKKGSRDKT